MAKPSSAHMPSIDSLRASTKPTIVSRPHERATPMIRSIMTRPSPRPCHASPTTIANSQLSPSGMVM